jgi:hypothetical protein
MIARPYAVVMVPRPTKMTTERLYGLTISLFNILAQGDLAREGQEGLPYTTAHAVVERFDKLMPRLQVLRKWIPRETNTRTLGFTKCTPERFLSDHPAK